MFSVCSVDGSFDSRGWNGRLLEGAKIKGADDASKRMQDINIHEDI